MAGCTKQNLDETGNVKPIIFTENAADKVAALIAEEGNPDLKLRIIIEGGGCSGFKYDITFDETVTPDDYVTTTKNVSLLIDRNSAKYLSGATIDYLEDIDGERFIINNPNAKNKCGCGTSFDIEE